MKRLHDRGMWEYDEDFPKDEEEPLGYSGFEWITNVLQVASFNSD